MCAFGNSAIEPMWSKCAWVMTMSVMSSGVMSISASMRSGEIQVGMPNLRENAAARIVLHEAGVDQHVRSSRCARMNENGRSITPS